MTTQITKETLITDGWQLVKDEPFIGMAKKIENANPFCKDETTDIYLIMLGSLGMNMPSVSLGKCGALYFKVDSMEELKELESKILFFEPNF